MGQLPKFTRQQAIYYLSALIDGEGSLCVTYCRSGIRSLHIANTDQGIIDAACSCLDVLGIDHRVYDKIDRTNKLGRKPVKDLVVGRRENFVKLNMILKLQSKAKADKLQEIVDSYREVSAA